MDTYESFESLDKPDIYHDFLFQEKKNLWQP